MSPWGHWAEVMLTVVKSIVVVMVDVELWRTAGDFSVHPDDVLMATMADSADSIPASSGLLSKPPVFAEPSQVSPVYECELASAQPNPTRSISCY